MNEKRKHNTYIQWNIIQAKKEDDSVILLKYHLQDVK